MNNLKTFRVTAVHSTIHIAHDITTQKILASNRVKKDMYVVFPSNEPQLNLTNKCIEFVSLYPYARGMPKYVLIGGFHSSITFIPYHILNKQEISSQLYRYHAASFKVIHKSTDSSWLWTPTPPSIRN